MRQREENKIKRAIIKLYLSFWRNDKARRTGGGVGSTLGKGGGDVG